jgi:hypothetical protein
MLRFIVRSEKADRVMVAEVPTGVDVQASSLSVAPSKP